MNSFSQNGEDLKVLDYFKGKRGTLLSLGENDGITLSNCYNLLLHDWKGVLVEPSKTAFEKLKRNTKVLDVELHNVAISDIPGDFVFYESGTHLKKGDTSLLSTLRKSELDRWKGSDNSFVETTVEAITFDMLLERSKYKKFDFISVDCEGVDWEILQQIDLDAVECKCLCIETNSVEDQKYINYCAKFGMKVYHKNFENLIFVR